MNNKTKCLSKRCVQFAKYLRIDFWYWRLQTCQVRSWRRKLKHIYYNQFKNMYSRNWNSIQKAFKSFRTTRIKFPSVALYKECTICAILRLIYPNLSSSHRGKNMLRNAAQRPDNNANLSGLSEKNVYWLRRKSAILSVR